MERRNNLLRLATEKLADATGLEYSIAEEKVNKFHLHLWSIDKRNQYRGKIFQLV